jgi:hypothetical protein
MASLLESLGQSLTPHLWADHDDLIWREEFHTMTTQQWGRSPRARWFQLSLCWLVLVLSACAPVEPSRWEEAQEATAGQSATASEALAGGEFNKFFPQATDGYLVVYTQEKRGFAEAVLKYEGEEVATLSIFDTVSNPEAAQKYKASGQRIGDYPAVEVGQNGAGILVADRFQVLVRAKSETFTMADRNRWLLAFDLAGLARLQ